VGKLASGRYHADGTSANWIKIKLAVDYGLVLALAECPDALPQQIRRLQPTMYHAPQSVLEACFAFVAQRLRASDRKRRRARRITRYKDDCGIRRDGTFSGAPHRVDTRRCPR
jgi:hypothetical protein